MWMEPVNNILTQTQDIFITPPTILVVSREARAGDFEGEREKAKREREREIVVNLVET